jgi:SAM-dependent methyltransferase
MNGYKFVEHPDYPHLGGNVLQGDSWTFAPNTWRYVIDRFAVSTVLDVGAGLGHAAHWFHKAGCQVVAMDGLPTNVNRAIFPVVQHDITNGPFKCPVDLVHCQEVVEHIEKKYIEELLTTLCNGKVIIMTHGEPGQPGHHHVNCQPSTYWIEKLDARGWEFLPEDTRRIRLVAANEGAHHLARSGLVFA